MPPTVVYEETLTVERTIMMRVDHSGRRRYSRAAVLGLAAVAGLAGCQAPITQRQRQRPEHIRAIWVTRMDYKTEADIVRIMDDCKSVGINTVLFQVRGNGTVFYPSRIEPWAEQFDHKDPGYDPLNVAIREAHRRGMLLEAYMNTMPAWNGPNPPKIRNQLYFTHPGWFWYDKFGHRQPLLHQVGGRTRGWYASLNPCLPEVRKYLVSVYQEVARRYDVDGVHLDYIRFPNEPVVPGEEIPDYPRDARTLALYKAATGLAPDADPARWMQWRADQVTELVREIHATVKRTRPGAWVTASVGADPERAKNAHFQDSRRWAREGLVDAVYPMNYIDDMQKFKERMSFWADAPAKIKVVQGIGVFKLKTGEALIEQIRAAEQPAGHFCLFAYSSLFSRTPDRANEWSEDRPAQMAARVGLLRKHLGIGASKAN